MMPLLPHRAHATRNGQKSSRHPAECGVQRRKPIAAAPHYRVHSAYGGTQRTEQLRQPQASCRWPFFNRLVCIPKEVEDRGMAMQHRPQCLIEEAAGWAGVSASRTRIDADEES